MKRKFRVQYIVLNKTYSDGDPLPEVFVTVNDRTDDLLNYISAYENAVKILKIDPTIIRVKSITSIY